MIQKTRFMGMALIMSLALSLGLFSQENDSIKNYYLDEVVITGTRTEKRLLDVPKSVSVITREQINNSGETNLAGLLANTEGINIIGTNQTPGSTQSYFLRGISNEQCVVMVDGIRVSDPSSINNGFDLSEISLVDVQKIEIVEGAHSTLYGSSAIGGVINIITNKNLNPGLNLRANINMGTFGSRSSMFNENLFLNYTFNNGFYASGEIFRSDVAGINAAVDTISVPGTFKNIDNDDFTKTDLLGKVGVKSEKVNAFISFRNINQFSDIDNGAYWDDDNNTVDLNRILVNYSFNYKINPNISFWLNGGGSKIERINENDSSLVDVSIYDRNYYTGTFEGGLINNDVQFTFDYNYFKIIAGGGIYYESMTSKTYSYYGNWGYESTTNLDSLDLHKTLTSFFFSADINSGLIHPSFNYISLMTGIRYNTDNFGNNHLSFEVNPYLKIFKNTMIFGSIASGFNSPSLYKLYTPESNYISGITRGNVNLDSEISISAEIGYKQLVGKNLIINLSFFQTHIKNSIQYIYLWDKNIDIGNLGNDWMRDDYRGDTYINLGNLTSEGIELNLMYRYKNILSIKGIINLNRGSIKYRTEDIEEDLDENYHVQLFESGKFLSTDQKLNNLARRTNTYSLIVDSRVTKSTNIGFSIRRIDWRKDIHYSADLGPYGALKTKHMKPYTLCNLILRQNFNRSFSGSLKVDNVFNTSYTEILGYNTKGISFYIGLSYTL